MGLAFLDKVFEAFDDEVDLIEVELSPVWQLQQVVDFVIGSELVAGSLFDELVCFGGGYGACGDDVDDLGERCVFGFIYFFELFEVLAGLFLLHAIIILYYQMNLSIKCNVILYNQEALQSAPSQIILYSDAVDRVFGVVQFSGLLGCILIIKISKMGNVCQDDEAIQHENYNHITEVKLAQHQTQLKPSEDLARKYAAIRTEAASFPHINNHVQHKIKRFSKFQHSANKSWKLKSPYNLIYTNQQAQDEYELPKRYVKIYKLKENGDFHGYYEGRVGPNYQPDLNEAFFIFHNASYFEGKGPDQGVYTNEVTNLKYQGGWKDEQPHGKGIQHNNKGVYEGEYYEGEKHGKGRFTWHDGSCYEGAFIKGAFNGKGIYTNKQQKYSYEGEYSNDLKHGMGVESKSRQIYTGQFYHNMRCGRGKLVVYEDDTKKDINYTYEGAFYNNKPNGRGIYQDFRTSSRKLDGIWSSGKLISICE